VYAPLVGALLLLVALPATAAAKGGCHHTVTPQGNSEAEQYSEVVPGPCGNQPANPGGSGGSSNSVPPATLQQLQSQGAAGQNAAALAQAGAPAGGAKHGAGGGGQGAGANNGQSSGGGAVSGIRDALGGDSGGDGMGLLLPLILAGTLLAGLTYWVMRRRRAGPAS
jgi:hypothetical protein